MCISILLHYLNSSYWWSKDSNQSEQNKMQRKEKLENEGKKYQNVYLHMYIYVHTLNPRLS